MGYKGLQKVPRDNRGLERVTRGYRRLQVGTANYRGLRSLRKVRGVTNC